jgi:hypothetical protein
MSICKFLK